MTWNGWLQILLFSLAVLACVRPLGRFMHRVMEPGDSRPPLPARALLPLERLIYRVCGIDPAREQTWTQYAAGLLAFSLVGVLLTYAHPAPPAAAAAQPAGVRGGRPSSSFNTAVSFTTNTNWQNYVRRVDHELPQPDGRPGVHNFTSAAVGMAIAIALARGLTRRLGPRAHRQLLGRRTRCDGLHPASRSAWFSPWYWSGRACPRTSTPTRRRPRWTGKQDAAPRGRLPARRSSRSWAPTAAASSTPTGPPLREPEPLTNFIEMFADLR